MRPRSSRCPTSCSGPGCCGWLRTRRWPREDEGLFDRTHLRWFGEADAIELLEQAGLRDVAVHPRYWVEGAALRRREWLARTPLRPYLAPQLILTAVKG